MPTSSQSQILSVVDYQLQQQQANGQTTTSKPPARVPVNPTTASESKRQYPRDTRRKSDDDNSRRQSWDKANENSQATRASQRNDALRMPVVNLHQAAPGEGRANSNLVYLNDRSNASQGRTKSALFDSSAQSAQLHRASNSDTDDPYDSEQRLKQAKAYPTPRAMPEFNSSASEGENETENENHERQVSSLNDNTRRLLVLGTIRPSKTFYKNLSEQDVNHLMDYFRRMKNTQQKVTSEDINEELAAKYREYKPKIFFDSACVTKSQVTQIEKMIEQHAEKIRTHQAEFVKLDNPMRFVIKPVDNDTPLTIIPREYHDCFITLVTRSDPLRKSDLIADLVHDQFLEDVKANSLDISYFPGGVNYDVPREEIDENGQMQVETYQKLKKRLSSRKVWYFSGQPEKKPTALLAILPLDSPIHINHQQLYDHLIDRLRTTLADDNPNVEERILSIEFLPLSYILNSGDMTNQFIVECDTVETKRQLMEKPLKVTISKQSTTIELQSYDENIQREYEKFVKSEKYRELIKNHDAAVKRSTSTK